MSDRDISIGLAGLGTALPPRWLPLAELPLTSTPETLAEFGFSGAYVADEAAPLALAAARAALTDSVLQPGDIDALLWASALPAAHQHRSAEPSGTVFDAFCYSASWLQEELELDRATVTGLAQQGCAGFFSALRLAHALLLSDPSLQHILCVGADALPSGSQREILYNVISDAACATVVSRHGVRERWRGYAQISKGYYWDVPARQSEILAAYFPTARLAILQALAQARWQPGDLDVVIPTGVNAASWPILLRLCGIAEDRLYQPRRRFGHTIAADSFLLLEEARAAGVLEPGMRVLLFAYGFGSSWCALLLEVAPEEAR